MTWLGLDVGTRRIGVAVGSTEVKLATPLTVIPRENVEKDASRLRTLAEQYEAGAVVIGLPRELDGAIGMQAQKVMAYADQLKPLLALDFEFYDERYSTAQALSQRRELGVSEKRGRATIDAAAAAIILQDYFDAMPSSTPDVDSKHPRSQ